MAFTSKTIYEVVDNVGVRFHRYVTAGDALATVVGAGYFNSYWRGFNVNDVIFVTASDGHRTYAVTVSSSSGVTIVAFT